jgi:ABC-2 type transport system permease protein
VSDLPKARWLTEFLWLLRGELYQLRSQWFWYVVYLSFSPLTYLFFLSIYGGVRTPEAQLYIITGSVANGAVASALVSLGQTIGRMRDQNALEYYASLPVSKLSFISAVAAKGVLLSCPSSLVILAVGVGTMGGSIHVSPILLIVAYLAGAFSLAGIGAVIGFYCADTQSVGLATQIIAPVLVLFAPVYVPLQQLPPILQVSARFLPTTYVAGCLRSALGYERNTYWGSLAVVMLWVLASVGLQLARVGWRSARE